MGNGNSTIDVNADELEERRRRKDQLSDAASASTSSKPWTTGQKIGAGLLLTAAAVGITIGILAAVGQFGVVIAAANAIAGAATSAWSFASGPAASWVSGAATQTWGAAVGATEALGLAGVGAQVAAGALLTGVGVGAATIAKKALYDAPKSALTSSESKAAEDLKTASKSLTQVEKKINGQSQDVLNGRNSQSPEAQGVISANADKLKAIDSTKKWQEVTAAKLEASGRQR